MLCYLSALPEVSKREKQQGHDSSPRLPDFKSLALSFTWFCLHSLPCALTVNELR